MFFKAQSLCKKSLFLEVEGSTVNLDKFRYPIRLGDSYRFKVIIYSKFSCSMPSVIVYFRSFWWLKIDLTLSVLCLLLFGALSKFSLNL